MTRSGFAITGVTIKCWLISITQFYATEILWKVCVILE